MWKAIAGLMIGILIGTLLCAPLYAGKEPKERTIDDSDGDGIVEFTIPLSKPFAYRHVCCSCGLEHTVFTQVVLGPVGLPWLYQRWKVDEKATHMNRMRKFGVNYMNPRASEFGAEHEDRLGERW